MNRVNPVKLLLFCVFFMVQSVVPVLAQGSNAPAALAKAMESVGAGHWDKAALAVEPAGSVGREIVEWHRLRASAGQFDEYIAFLERRPDWPGLGLLRKAGEWRIPTSVGPEVIIAYFKPQLPQTGTGSLRLAKALRSKGLTGESDAEIVRAWRNLSMNASEEGKFLAAYAKLLAPHHAVRQDMLLWARRITDAARLNALVDKKHRALAAARIALIKNRKGVNGLINAVPAPLNDDAGMAFDRFKWRLKRKLSDSAMKLMQSRSTSAAALGKPNAWASERRSMARQLMRDGKSQAAYDLASRHFLTSGSNFTDLEWLSGFIALTDLKDAKLALEHFRRFRGAVDTPISLGRAGYWEGRAHEALGDSENAHLAYAFGGEYQTSFYGQLAAEKAGLKMDPSLTGREVYPSFSETPHGKSSVLQAALLFQKAGLPLLFTRFTRHLAERLTTPERGALAQIALDLKEPYAALYMAKYAARSGTVLARPYFPVTDIIETGADVPAELTLSIARRESEFYSGATSGVGARGLMQLMPRTAQEMARKKGLKFQLGRLTSDPKYNATLGTAYLAELIAEFGDYYPFIAAGYNAGPSRPKRWLKRYGDPRRSVEHAVDWIEHIPFRETRNYVMRVMESLPVYRARLAGKPVELSLSRELTGG
ncbi:MAG: lytic transglycosylase domain-containing protein [Marinosulfonomonas sp.]|nr:lytic transglycosylase domain-containing protein [Marinosulfonomonas sp.]